MAVPSILYQETLFEDQGRYALKLMRFTNMNTVSGLTKVRVFDLEDHHSTGWTAAGSSHPIWRRSHE